MLQKQKCFRGRIFVDLFSNLLLKFISDRISNNSKIPGLHDLIIPHGVCFQAVNLALIPSGAENSTGGVK
jgi:hypothetical protein